MAVFGCRRCGAILTPSLKFGAPDRSEGGALVGRGQYFVDPEPSRETFDARTDELVGATSANCVIVNPRDAGAVHWHEESGNWSGCCGPDGDPAGNLLCSQCGEPVGTLSADCWTALEVRLEPEAIAWIADAQALESPPAEQRPTWYDVLRGDPMTKAERIAAEAEAEGDEDEDESRYDRTLAAFTMCAGAGKIWIAVGNAPLVVVVDCRTATIEDVVELPNAEPGRRQQHLPRWLIPTIAFGAGVVWVVDVIEPGVFAIDAATHTIAGRVPIAADPRGPDYSPSTEIAASDDLVAVTGHGQGDVVLIDPHCLAIDEVVRAGRSLRGIAIDGSTIWVGDDADDTVRRVEPGNGVTATTRIEGRPSAIKAGLGHVWVTASTDVIPLRTPLHRVDPASGAISRTARGEWDESALCTDDGTVWLLDEFFHESARRERLAEEEAEWHTESALIALDADSLERVSEVIITGQVHDVVAEAGRLWALTFSVSDQAHVLVGADLSTGHQVRVGLGHIDVSSYDPPLEPLPQLTDEAFFRSVQAACDRAIRDAVDIEACTVDLATTPSPRLIVSVAEAAPDERSWLWELDLPSLGERDRAAAERLAEVVAATFRALWASRARAIAVGSLPQRLD